MRQMRCRGLGYWSIWMAAAALITVATAPSVVYAQTAGSGVIINPDGVLRTRVFADPNGQLMQERVASAKATIDSKLIPYSKLRKVSLNRLEKVIRDRNGVLTDEMRYMAGLLRVKYVFYYPDSKDIVLAGPAEGWVPDPAGRVVGITSGRPVIQLQDTAVALRMFPPDGKETSLIGCSIDPTQQGLASMQHFLRTNRPDFRNPQAYAEQLRNCLGLQVVTINGVPAKTHFAQVLVEADYRMKLIGIGLERPPVKMVSYVEKARFGDVARNAMARWFFVPDYQCIRESEDGLAMEMVGDGVKLIGEDEMVTSSGERKKAGGRGNRASKVFVDSFTKKYPELAERSPVYAELRNLIDLSVAAAYIQKQDLYDRAGWDMPFLGSEKAFPVEVYDVPKTVETAVSVIGNGKTKLGFPIGGGVEIRATEALQSENLLADKKEKVAKLHKELKPNLAEGQWWWD